MKFYSVPITPYVSVFLKEKVKGYDGRVIDMTGVSCGEEMDFRRLQELVEKKITDAGKFHEICSDCGWAEICHKRTF